MCWKMTGFISWEERRPPVAEAAAYGATSSDYSAACCEAEIVLELSRAAALGSEHACCLIAGWLALGQHSLVRDDAAATWWYKESLNCRAKDGAEPNKAKRDRWLAEHP